MDPARARALWMLFEPYHAIYFFASEGREAYKAAGLKGGWMAYFAARSAAMGPVSSEVVLATFYNFHPHMVRRAIPDAWRFSSPDVVLETRRAVVDGALRRLLGDLVHGNDVKGAEAIAARVVAAARPEGRPLFAAEAALPIPDEPHLALWRHATCLREHRGDGHVAALVAAGIDGCQAHVVMTDYKGIPAAMQREYRGWSEEEWNDAIARLQARGLHDGATLTDEGRAAYEEVERITDERAAEPWAAVSDDEVDAFERHMRVLVDVLMEEGLPYPNPMGLTRPSEQRTSVG